MMGLLREMSSPVLGFLLFVLKLLRAPPTGSEYPLKSVLKKVTLELALATPKASVLQGEDV